MTYCRITVPMCSAPSDNLAFPRLSAEIFIVTWVQPGLVPCLCIERALNGALKELADIATEDLNGVGALLLADPGQPAVAGGDVGDLVIVDHVEGLDAVSVAGRAELLDGQRVDVETALIRARRSCDVRTADSQSPWCTGCAPNRLPSSSSRDLSSEKCLASSLATLSQS